MSDDKAYNELMQMIITPEELPDINGNRQYSRYERLRQIMERRRKRLNNIQVNQDTNETNTQLDEDIKEDIEEGIKEDTTEEEDNLGFVDEEQRNSKYWMNELEKEYGVEVSELDNTENWRNVMNIYSDITEGINILNNYKEDNDIQEARNRFGKLLVGVIDNARYTSYKYLIELGAPIKGYKNAELSNAYIEWKIDALKLVSKERLTNYLKYKAQASPLLNYIYLYKDLESLEYILDNDRRENNERSVSYKKLLTISLYKCSPKHDLISKMLLNKVRFSSITIKNIVIESMNLAIYSEEGYPCFEKMLSLLYSNYNRKFIELMDELMILGDTKYSVVIQSCILIMAHNGDERQIDYLQSLSQYKEFNDMTAKTLQILIEIEDPLITLVKDRAIEVITSIINLSYESGNVDLIYMIDDIFSRDHYIKDIIRSQKELLGIPNRRRVIRRRIIRPSQ